MQVGHSPQFASKAQLLQQQAAKLNAEKNALAAKIKGAVHKAPAKQAGVGGKLDKQV